MKKRIICTLAAALIVSTTAAFGAIKEGSFSVTPLIGGYVFDGGTYLDPTLVLGLRAGYNFTKHFGIEAVYDYATSTDGKTGPLKDISMNRFGGQALYHLFPDNAFVPYLAAGYSGVDFEGTGVNNKIHGAFDYGVGAKYFLNDYFALRGDVRHILYDINSKTYNDLEFTLGAYFQFGESAPAVKAIAPAPAPAPAPEPVKVAAPVPDPVQAVAVPAPAPVVAAPIMIPPSDSDGDGVIDTLDSCPGTAAEVKVDAKGCPVETAKQEPPH
jgi:OOP family OmpA-OmpF porin